MWFHLDEYPSAHVVLKQNSFELNLSYNKEIIIIASNYCKSYSKHEKKIPKVKIVYTQIKNLKKGKNIGSVIISNANYISV